MAAKKQQRAQKPDDWSVYDMNARQPDGDGGIIPRTHEIRLGTTYALRFDEPTHMPEADARRFLGDPAFRVLNAEGDEIKPLSAMARTRVMPDRIARDEVVANLTELTTDALVTRALMSGPKEKFSTQTRREVLIEFLTGQAAAMDVLVRKGAGLGLEDEGELETEDMEAEEMGSLALQGA